MFTVPVEVRAPSRQRRGSSPIHRSGPERHFPCSPDPFQAPRSPAGPPRPAEPSETTGQAKFLREDAFRGGIGLLGIRSGWGWGLWPPVRQRGMDYLRARLVTPYYYKKVIATGVMNHDRFVGVDAPYRDAQKGRSLAPSAKGSRCGDQSLVRLHRPRTRAPGVMAPQSASASGNQKS